MKLADNENIIKQWDYAENIAKKSKDSKIIGAVIGGAIGFVIGRVIPYIIFANEKGVDDIGYTFAGVGIVIGIIAGIIIGGMIGKRNQISSITVTNKRIVAMVKNRYGITQSEIYIKDVTYVYSCSNSRAVAIVFIILGVLLYMCSMFVAFALTDELGAEESEIIADILKMFGFVLIIIGIILLLYNEFVVIISTDKPMGTALAIGASNLKKRKKAAVRVRVNKETALQIQRAIGAVILNAKSNKSGNWI